MDEDDFADRTLAPTERRRREARQRGQVARSAELTSAIGLLATTCLLWFILPASANSLIRLLRSPLGNSPPATMTTDAAIGLITATVRDAATILAPILLVLVTFAVVANLVQTGWLWIPTALIPRIRGGTFLAHDWPTKVAGTLVRLPILACVAANFLMTHQLPLRSMGLADPVAMLVQPAQLFGELSIQLAVCLVLLALVDYGFQYWRNERRLMMTVEERRREQRDEAIDPRIKQRQAAQGPPVGSASLAEIERIVVTDR